MTVTSVKPQGKRKIRIVLDEKTAFNAYRWQIKSWGLELSEMSELSDDDAKTLMQQARRLAAQSAMNRLVKRDYARGELLSALKRSGFSDDLALAALDYLSSYGYIDDGRFAREYIRSYGRNTSSRMLMMKLRQKGVADDIIKEAIEESGRDDRECIRSEIYKRYGEEIPSGNSREYQKLVQSLIRKGYNYSDICSVIRRYSRE